MGLWKEGLMSMESLQLICEGVAIFKITETGETIEIKGDEIDWCSEFFSPGREEVLHGIHYSGETNGQDGDGNYFTVRWDIYECMGQIFGDSEPKTEGCELLKNFDSYDFPDNYSYPDYELEDYELESILSNNKPIKTFESDVYMLKRLKEIEIDDTLKKVLYKQIIVNLITCLEVYLSDTLIGHVKDNEIFLERFVSNFNEFTEEKIKRSKIFDEYRKIEKTAQQRMSKLLYHNIDKIKCIYEFTFEISFPQIEKLRKHIKFRHDLVHRNGKDKDGQEHFVGKQLVEEIISEVEEFVRTIESLVIDDF